MITKSDLRREIREQRRRLDPGWVRQASERIQRRLLALPEWVAARRVCCYLATPAEVQTGSLLAVCRQMNKPVWAPAWREETGRYECVRLNPDAPLAAGRYGILEPAREKQDAGGADLDLAIVPGLAFDRRGGRLGHGRGYYDRLLAAPPLAQALKIGLAFAFQLRAAVPTGASDAPMDIVVTEDAVFRRRAEEA